MMTFHSSHELSVSVRDAVNTDLDTRANLLIMQQFGQELKANDLYRILYTYSEQILAFSYAVENLSDKPIEADINFSNSDGMLMGNSKSKEVRKIIPGR
jgi:hypothetical protein